MGIRLTGKRLARLVSKYGVILSTVQMLAGLGALVLGSPVEHGWLMLFAGLLLFPHSVALAYVMSGARQEVEPLINVTSLLTIPGFATPLVASLWEPEVAGLTMAPAFALMVASSVAASRGRTGSLRLSLELFSLTYAFTLASIIVQAVWDGWDLIRSGLALTLSYPVPLIYSVTAHSLPSTFGDAPSRPLSILSVLLAGVAGLDVSAGGPLIMGVALAFASVLAYVYGARLVRVTRYFASVRSRLRPGTPAFEGMKYYLDGHFYVIVLTALMALNISYWIVAHGCDARCGLLVLHMFALGFSWLHVAIHAPMMIPVILGVRHAKRYTSAPFILTLLAVPVWPSFGFAGLLLIVASFAAMLYVFVSIR